MCQEPPLGLLRMTLCGLWDLEQVEREVKKGCFSSNFNPALPKGDYLAGLPWTGHKREAKVDPPLFYA